MGANCDCYNKSSVKVEDDNIIDKRKKDPKQNEESKKNEGNTGSQLKKNEEKEKSIDLNKDPFKDLKEVEERIINPKEVERSYEDVLFVN